LKFPQRINKIVPKVLKEMNIETRTKNWEIVEKWVEIVGKRVAQHAKATAVDTDRLYVEVDNPVWQSQLFLMKKMILEKIRKQNVYIKDISFRVVNHHRKDKRDHEKEQ